MQFRIPPELASRCIAARAVVADYRREVEQNPELPRVHVYWAPRLASIIDDLVAGVDLIGQVPA